MEKSKKFEDEVIGEALDKAFERLGYNLYSFSEELKDTYESEMSDYDNTDGFFDDLACSGCQGMALGGFIYHDELEDFYLRHHDDIESFKNYLEQDIGSPLYDGSGHYADFACWLVIEEVAYNVRDEVHKLAQELEPALLDKLDRLGADPAKYIRIKSEEKLAEDSLTRGNLQSLFQEKQRGNGLKF